MVTELLGTGLSPPVVGQATAAAVQRPMMLSRQEVVGSVGHGERTSSSTRVASAYAQLQVRQDELNNAASVVREVGDVVAKAGTLLDKAESNLGSIVKMYPPYPIDNPQRIALLNNVVGLRKQIDDLTFPAPEEVDAVSRQLGSGVVGKADALTLRSDEVAKAKEQLWELPDLDPVAAGDDEVRKALDQVREAKASLETLQAGMWQDVVDFVKGKDASEVQDKGAGVGEQLAVLGNRGISSHPRQLEQVVEPEYAG